MELYSHRGFHTDLLENTLAAFAAAVALGVDGIETDLRLSADGQIMVFHDAVAPSGEAVAALTLSQLCDQAGQAVLTLPQVLDWTEQHNYAFRWNFEIKTPETFGPTLDLLTTRSLPQPPLVTSFWHDCIQAAATQRSDLDFGLIWAHYPADFDQVQWFDLRANVSTLVVYQERLTPNFVSQVHQRQMRLFTYGDQSLQDLQRLHTWGVDAVISDRPDWWLDDE
ncbi:glycerophosphodiester phosphodiesterase [Lyngbya confervoides]|uniref:Glycerophosphodiester phosphodiesterase n=1 Tax=Lyngbya confervoides BDU141951 TaxID=1574623 RepID=A0ABD4T1D8_9CYAN|nr:glycerophosphodiester phosphodiesterase [Lyngbya confervoides]MCM1982458.1 glycerophosphodiester phosphodiesterase [Lyngbya confervoides BDU141951]